MRPQPKHFYYLLTHGISLDVSMVPSAISGDDVMGYEVAQVLSKKISLKPLWYYRKLQKLSVTAAKLINVHLAAYADRKHLSCSYIGPSATEFVVSKKIEVGGNQAAAVKTFRTDLFSRGTDNVLAYTMRLIDYFYKVGNVALRIAECDVYSADDVYIVKSPSSWYLVKTIGIPVGLNQRTAVDSIMCYPTLDAMLFKLNGSEVKHRYYHKGELVSLPPSGGPRIGIVLRHLNIQLCT